MVMLCTSAKPPPSDEGKRGAGKLGKPLTQSSDTGLMGKYTVPCPEKGADHDPPEQQEIFVLLGRMSERAIRGYFVKGDQSLVTWKKSVLR